MDATCDGLLAMCPQLVGHVLHWKLHTQESRPFACLAQGKVMLTETYQVLLLLLLLLLSTHPNSLVNVG